MEGALFLFKEVVMTQQNETQTEVLFTESPASWNTKYMTPEGFVCQLTLRDDNGVRLLEKTLSAMQELLMSGCLPYPINLHGVEKNLNGNPDAWCSVHNCEMKRWEKGGKVWFSHQTQDAWCYGGK